MITNKDTGSVQLQALIIYCCPESGHFLPVADNDLPAFFSRPDIAVSYSAQSRGWVRPLAQQFKVYTGADEENLLLRLNTYDLLLVYPLSLNSLAKFALGIQDSFPTRVFAEAAALGKPILLNDQALPDPDGQMNPHLLRTYRRHWESLLSGTIAAFNLENLDEVAVKILRNRADSSKVSPSGDRRFITRDDIIAAAASLEPLRISCADIVTDLAREEAEARGVSIIRN